MRKQLSMLLATALVSSTLMACATSNQVAETTAAPTTTAVAKEETSAPTDKAEVTEAAESTESTTGISNEGYTIKPFKKEGTLKVALIPVTINTSYTMTINGANERIKIQGYDMEITVQAPAGNTSSIEEQGNIIENMIQQKVDAIALATESDSSMLPYLKEAEKAGIPLFFFNMTELDPQDNHFVTSIGYDQYAAGNTIGKWVADHYGDKETKVAVLEGYPGIVNDMRMNGFKDAIADKSNIQIVASQVANWTRADGQTVTESILTANPDINVLYGDYDEMVLGGMVAIKDRGLQDKIDVVGYGATEDAINAIRAGEMVASVDSMEYYTGYDIVDAIHKFCVEGEEVETVINRDTVVYDQDNIDTHDDSVFAK